MYFICPLADKRGAYTPHTEWDSLIISVGKIKIATHAHRRETCCMLIIPPTAKNINRKI